MHRVSVAISQLRQIAKLRDEVGQITRSRFEVSE